MSVTPLFPPLLTGLPVAAQVNPFDKAVSEAVKGIDSGSLFYAQAEDSLRAALVLAPETSLEDALAAVYVAQIGLAESIGALAPPETPVHFAWPDRIKINGAICGQVKFAAETREPDSHPQWLVVGIDIPFASRGGEPGQTPNQTCLYEEGCGDVHPMNLLESWSKHTLLWLTHWLDEGFEKVHKEWRPRCDTLGETISYPREGVFVGLDEQGRMLLRVGAMTDTLSLTEFTETA